MTSSFRQRERGSSQWRIVAAGLLGWLLPGLGHLYIGRRAQGLVLFAVLTATFWGGVAIGGVRSTVNPQKHRAWFAAQLLNGSHTLAVLAWRGQLPRTDPQTDRQIGRAVWPADEIAIVYTGIAGLLNLLLILDVTARAGQPNPPGTPRSLKGASSET